MIPAIEFISQLKPNMSSAIVFSDFDVVASFPEVNPGYLDEKLKDKQEWTFYKQPEIYFFHKIDEKKEDWQQMESAREAGAKLFEILKSEKTTSLQITGKSGRGLVLPFLEGLLLSAYTFTKYKKVKEDFALSEIFLHDAQLSESQLNELKNIVGAVFLARNLVNEPLSYLTAVQFSKEMEEMGKKAGFSVEVLNRKRIEALAMGGLLAVNKGSIDPPTFTIMEWKPENPVNSQPVVLVGKGVVFDTGGLSLKPTAKSMDYMKCDMGGGAVVAATLYAVAKNNLPLHLIGLVPATDNRPDGNAYVPGDIITMFDETTVEIKNTDAEGRLLLADALAYAKKHNPVLVIDVATLTGSAEIIAGSQAIVAMGNSPAHLEKMKQTGQQLYERIIEVPLWEEYGKPLKSLVADLNNLGTREGQTSIAGKFLEHFTDYPWLHLDIAGVAFLHEKSHYRPQGGTGYGTRLLYHFLKAFN